MTEIEKMKKYIIRTNISWDTKKRYGMYISESGALYDEVDKDRLGVISLAFMYGMAKGYRAAKAEGRA